MSSKRKKNTPAATRDLRDSRELVLKETETTVETGASQIAGEASYVSDAVFRSAKKRVFDKHAELLSKLAK